MLNIEHTVADARVAYVGDVVWDSDRDGPEPDLETWEALRARGLTAERRAGNVWEAVEADCGEP